MAKKKPAKKTEKKKPQQPGAVPNGFDQVMERIIKAPWPPPKKK